MRSSRGSGTRARPSVRPGNCRTWTGAWSRSRARWLRGPKSCCSTSLPRDCRRKTPTAWAWCPGEGRRPEALIVQGLTTGYGAAPVLEDVSLSVREGELVALLGANGAGKSTLLRALVGLHRPNIGSMSLAGHEISRAEAHSIAR